MKNKLFPSTLRSIRCYCSSYSGRLNLPSWFCLLVNKVGTRTQILHVSLRSPMQISLIQGENLRVWKERSREKLIPIQSMLVLATQTLKLEDHHGPALRLTCTFVTHFLFRFPFLTFRHVKTGFNRKLTNYPIDDPSYFKLPPQFLIKRYIHIYLIKR